MYPDMVDGLLPFCGSARCWPLNRIFLSSVRAALRADATFANGAYHTPPKAGLRAFGRVYAGWAFSAEFFRKQLYRSLGCGDIEQFMTVWEEDHLGWDACDLLAMLWTWEHADLGQIPGFDGNFEAAMGAIRARAIVMPCDQDRYFTLEENEIEVAMLSSAELRPFRSPYGHCAGAPGRFASETAELTKAFHDVLREVRGTA
jgi:homoserine O-acetyltransferase